MDTLKTGFIVLLLLAVLYGVYVVLNKDQSPPTAEIAWHQQQADQELQIDIGAPTDPTAKANAPAGKHAGEPDLLKTPDNAGGVNKAPGLGIPSVVTAELSPIPDDSPTVDAVPSDPTTIGNLPGLGGAANGPNPVTQESPIARSGMTPDAKSSGVSAPSLLAGDSAYAVTTPAKESASERERSGDLTSLPALRESPTSLPDLKLPTAPVRPSTTFPDPLEGANSPTKTAQPPLLAQGSSTASAVIAPDLKSTLPAESTPTAELESSASPKPVTTAAAFDAAMREAQSNLAEEKWYQALFILSKFYGSPDLSSQQHQELIDLLDPLAAKVVYSQDHLVTDAHEVRRGDTLAQIAAANQVPPELLSNINGIENPDLLVPGTKLKLVRGPFRADVDLQRKELTLFAGLLYAGRFPISVGQDPEPQPGEYRVLEKQPGRDYFAGSGQKMAANDPQNPFGRVWIGLDKELAIHGSPERGDAGTMGCISLSPLDATDVYGILTQGSSITIRR